MLSDLGLFVLIFGSAWISSTDVKDVNLLWGLVGGLLVVGLSVILPMVVHNHRVATR